jgi:uncharacterized protein (TIGR02145 family)
MKKLILFIPLVTLFGCEPEEVQPEPQTENSVLYDGHYYEYVQIGDLYWFTENLKTTIFSDGTSIPFVPDGLEWENSTGLIPCYTYFDVLEDNKNTIGCLYNGISVLDDRNLCPVGWHVSTDDDWKNLEMSVGSVESNYDGWVFMEGISVDLKSSENDVPAWNGSNFTGFSAIPGGYIESDGDFENETDSYWFTKTEDNTDVDGLIGRGMSTNNTWVRRCPYPKTQGLFIRCVKD